LGESETPKETRYDDKTMEWGWRVSGRESEKWKVIVCTADGKRYLLCKVAGFSVDYNYMSYLTSFLHLYLI
jgi:hypothetical protein